MYFSSLSRAFGNVQFLGSKFPPRSTGISPFGVTIGKGVHLDMARARGYMMATTSIHKRV